MVNVEVCVKFTIYCDVCNGTGITQSVDRPSIAIAVEKCGGFWHASQVRVSRELRVDGSGISSGMVQDFPQDHFLFTAQAQACCAVSKGVW